MVKSIKYLFVLFFLLIFTATALAVDFSTHGYYRTRVVALDNTDLQRPNSSIAYSNNRFGFVSYNQMRLRLEPNLKLNDHISIQAEFDILDNVLYGTKDTKELNVLSPLVGTLTMPAGAGSFWMTGGVAGDNQAINIRRVWADILTPIGKFRLGRQPSHWGLGIFQNDGRERQGDFGDTADRILYLFQKDLAGAGSVTGGLSWDIAYEAQTDQRLGFGGTVQDLAMPSNSRDTQQYAALFIYDRTEATVGVFGGIRRRDGRNGATTMTVTDALQNEVAAGVDGDTLLYFIDLYAKYQYENYKFQLEGVYVGGKVSTGVAVDAVPFQGLGAADPANPCGTGGIICLPQNQSMQVLMAAFEAEADYKWGGSWKIQTGFAQGDGDVLSGKITQLGFRPDYQIALLMFNRPLGTSPSYYGEPAYDPGTTAKLGGGQWLTGNYINNAVYLTAGYKHEFDVSDVIAGCEFLKVGGKIVTAWAHKKNVNVDFAQVVGTANLPTISETASSFLKRWYGLEFDLSVEAKLFEYLYTALEGGVLIPGREYNIEVNVTDPGALIEPIPQDNANLGWGIRLTASIEF
ncbi:MAG: hypothetical protein ABH859_05580 [Pseudomonadota bacterium]